MQKKIVTTVVYKLPSGIYQWYNFTVCLVRLETKMNCLYSEVKRLKVKVMTRPDMVRRAETYARTAARWVVSLKHVDALWCVWYFHAGTAWDVGGSVPSWSRLASSSSSDWHLAANTEKVSANYSVYRNFTRPYLKLCIDGIKWVQKFLLRVEVWVYPIFVDAV